MTCWFKQIQCDDCNSTVFLQPSILERYFGDVVLTYADHGSGNIRTEPINTSPSSPLTCAGCGLTKQRQEWTRIYESQLVLDVAEGC